MIHLVSSQYKIKFKTFIFVEKKLTNKTFSYL